MRVMTLHETLIEDFDPIPMDNPRGLPFMATTVRYVSVNKELPKYYVFTGRAIKADGSPGNVNRSRPLTAAEVPAQFLEALAAAGFLAFASYVGQDVIS